MSSDNLDVDIWAILPTIQVPTLILHRTDEAWLSVEQSRYAASKILWVPKTRPDR